MDPVRGDEHPLSCIKCCFQAPGKEHWTHMTGCAAQVSGCYAAEDALRCSRRSLAPSTR
jgi:hypothetical protein